MAIQLDTSEINLRQKIQEHLEKFYVALKDGDKSSELTALLKEAGTLAHQLHISLKNKGNEPKHHSYMVKNRGMQPDHADFYEHIHPLQDLLKFIDNPTANNDPVDQTIGAEFQLKYYTRRWGRDQMLHLTRIPNGWEIRDMEGKRTCDKGGNPVLLYNLNHDYVCYPNELESWIEWLWNEAERKGLSANEVQQALDQLGDWMKLVETNVPTGHVWKGYA